VLKTALLSILLVLTILATASAQTVRPLRLTTIDDVGISAAYYPTTADPAPAVVLLHDFGRSRDEWISFAGLLQRNGIAALAIDLRGHGESTRKLTAQGPQRVDVHDFTPRDFEDMLLDVEAAFDWIADQPGIDKHRIGLVGSSLGANVALRYAAFNEDLAALLLLSPGMTYRGLRADEPMRKLGPIPLRLVVSQFDAFYFESSKRLLEIRHERDHNTEDAKELTICSGNLHGTAMLKGVNGLTSLLLDWLKQALRVSAPSQTGSPVPQTAPPVPVK
jgi:dienelactone hydrolase